MPTSARHLTALRNAVAEGNAGHPDDFEGWRQRAAATLRVALGAQHPAVKAFEAVDYTPAIWTSETPGSYFAQVKADGVREAIAVLEGAIHELELREPAEPELSPEALHSWIAGAVAGLWDNGHYRQAVDEATRAIEIRLKAKARSELSGYRLVTEAFSPAPPGAGQTRLRFVDFREGTPAWTDAHQGAMAFAQGCVMRIRNVLEHTETEVDRQVALEQLAALSLLARWVDEAVVVAA